MKKLLIILFFAWVVLWAWFVARGLLAKGAMADYRALLSVSLEGKRAYVTGEKLYEFLAFCNERLPAYACYRIAGLDDSSIDRRRAVYYLYPHLEDKKGDYLLVFGGPHEAPAGYTLFAELDEERRILVRGASERGL